MNRAEFIRQSGGVYRSRRSWGRWSSRHKAHNFWSFFRRPEGKAFSIYSGIPVRDLLRERQYSIEHIVPKTYLEQQLFERHIRNGATKNPFNFAAAHSVINARRGARAFDLDNDVVVKEYCTRFYSIDQQTIGIDHQGEWIVPHRSRGDITRAVFYMHLLYGLPTIPAADVRIFQQWALNDPVSGWETAYCRWKRSTMRIGNPFIEQPQLIEDAELLKELTTR